MTTRIKLVKDWGSFKAGDVVRCGRWKGRAAIDAGYAMGVPKQRAVNEPETPERPAVETATNNPDGETATAVPQKKPETKNNKRAKKPHRK